MDKRTAASVASLEQFGALSRYIDETLRQMSQALRSGSVTADPWFKSSRETACTFCDWRQACLFDAAGDGWRMRTKLSTEAAWERIEGHE